jgi:hypothetical protein
VLYFQLRKEYFAKYFSVGIVCVCIFCAVISLQIRINFDDTVFAIIHPPSRTRHHAPAMLGGSRVVDSVLWTQHTRVLIRRGSTTSAASSSSTTSGQASRDYINCASCTTCSSDDPVAPDEKAKCSSSSKIHLFIYFRHTRKRGAAPLYYYSKFTQHLGLCHYFVIANILGYLVNFFSSALDIAQWIYFRLSENTFFGSVDLFSAY